MPKYKLIFLLFLALVALTASNQALACADGSFGGGDGSSNNPWQIHSATHLNNLRNCLSSTHASKHFILSQDIDLSQSPWTDGDGWEPIGVSGNSFHATFNGNSKVISGLTINRPSETNVGLFGFLRGASISNLYIIGAEIFATASVGVLVGQAHDSTQISNVHTQGKITATKAGTNYSDAGGLAGDLYSNSRIEGSSANVNVLGTGRNIGGLLGYLQIGEVINSFAIGNVENTLGDRGYIGGLIGRSSTGTLENCFATGQVKTGNQSSGDAGAGGLSGNTTANLTITNCYSIGEVIVTGGAAGGLTGTTGATVTNSYWNTTTSGQASSPLGTGKTTAELQDPTTFTGWDFTNTWVMSSAFIHQQYPLLQFANLQSTAVTSGQVSSPAHLLWISEDTSRWADSYTQTADINLYFSGLWDSRQGFSPIGNLANKFTGSYNGGNFKIHGLFMRRNQNYVGLFGYAEGSTLQNIKLYGPAIQGNNFIGSLAGYLASSTVTNIQSLGLRVQTITATDAGSAGGLVGYVETSTLSHLLAAGSLIGYQRSGGLIGWLKSDTATLSKSLVDVNISTASQNARFMGGAIAVAETGAPSISEVVALGDVSLASVSSGDAGDIGGFIGLVTGSALIKNSYARGSVTGPAATTNGARGIGGFAGRATSSAVIENSYSVNTVATTGGTLGGFVGNSSGSPSVTNSFWDVTVSGVGSDSSTANSSGGMGKSTANMKDVITFVNAGWDFQTETFNGSDNFWGINSTDRSAYPFLSWEAFTHDSSRLEFTVTFQDHDATLLKSETVIWKNNATPPSDPTRTGYTFSGWSATSTGITANTTLTAQYTINQYTLTFNSAGGSAVSAITQNYNTAITPPADPTRAGYTFLGWSPAIPSNMPAANTTLVAIWNRCTLAGCSTNTVGDNTVTDVSFVSGNNEWDITVTRPTTALYPVTYEVSADLSGQTFTTNFESSYPGTQVYVEADSNGNPLITASLTLSGSSLTATTNSEGLTEHKIDTGSAESVARSTLASAKTEVDANGNVKTSLRMNATNALASGDIRAYVETNPDGESSSGFERYNGSAWEKISPTLPTSVIFEPGHTAEIVRKNGNYGVEIITPITSTLQF